MKKRKPRRKKELFEENMLEVLDIDSSKISQRFASTMGLNGCILVVISASMPWLLMDINHYIQNYRVQIDVYLLRFGMFVPLAGGVLLGGFFLRSIIKKKFTWSLALLFYILIVLMNIMNYFTLRSIYVSDTRCVHLTSALLMNIIGSILIALGGTGVYLFRNKEEEQRNLQKYTKPGKMKTKKKKSR
ncbi:MAG: hypothetical protein KAW12_30930 [Candidatus Aminicenantes bacterium]|nr:hypothetical protein [Candidatus Aminicenantes bacterium]